MIDRKPVKFLKLFIFTIFTVSALAFIFTACENPILIELLKPLTEDKNPSKTDPADNPGNPGDSVATPTAGDFDIDDLTQEYDGSPKSVTITPKAGKSGGVITIYYKGSTTPPSAVGTYTVTFDVAAAEGWNAASNLSAGTLTINPPVINSADLESYLTALPPNDADHPYFIKINDVTNTSFKYNNLVKINAIATNIAPYYVHLDFSGSNITSVPDYALYGAYAGIPFIVGITLPDGITSIGNQAFMECQGLTSINIPASVTSIGSYAFCSCTSLTSITIPSSVTSIGDYAFLSCTSLTDITIPAGVTSIGNLAFDGNPNLTSVTFEGAITANAFGSNVFGSGDLVTKYLAEGAGTYTRIPSGSTWTKQY